MCLSIFVDGVAACRQRVPEVESTPNTASESWTQAATLGTFCTREVWCFMKRVAAMVEYDGRGFSGWQRQIGQNTVQQEVEQALARVANHDIGVVAAGRTDTGVHACGQVIHFDTDSERQQHEWLRGSNSFLPDVIRLQWVGEVDHNFHARFSARRRFYRYIVLNRETESALYTGRATLIRRALDVELMQEAASWLIGRHDFSSYRAVSCQSKSPVREIVSLQVTRFSSWIVVDIEADGFLHHMVRNIVGTLIEVGSGDRPTDWPKEVLDGRDRRLAGVTASAHGLYLVAVTYPDDYPIPEPYLPRFW